MLERVWHMPSLGDLQKANDAVEAARNALTRLEREYADILLKAVSRLNELSPDDQEGMAALKKSVKAQVAQIQKEIDQAKEKLREAEKNRDRILSDFFRERF
jgi:flagellar biosynthesis chaperone FliJ